MPTEAERGYRQWSTVCRRPSPDTAPDVRSLIGHVYSATIPTFPISPPGIHVNYASTVLPMKDGLPEAKPPQSWAVPGNRSHGGIGKPREFAALVPFACGIGGCCSVPQARLGDCGPSPAPRFERAARGWSRPPLSPKAAVSAPRFGRPLAAELDEER